MPRERGQQWPCDFSAIALDASTLHFAPGHTVQREHLRYHNERILRQPG